MPQTDYTYLAIDYGERRIGLAKSDPTGLIASPLTTLTVKSDRDALNQLRGFIDEYRPAAIIIGYPLHDSGDKSQKCKQIDAFVIKLEQLFDGPIHRVDESRSSLEAQSIIHAHGKQAGRDKARIDRIAAVIILQRFLDEQPREDV